MRVDRRAGIEHHARLLAQLADMLKRAMDMRPGFGMHRDAVGAGLGEGFQIGIHRRDHQMHVERLFGVGPKRLHHRRSDGDVGHEMAVHHIDMDEIGARRLDRLDLRAQPGKIGRQDRRRDSDDGPRPCECLPLTRGLSAGFLHRLARRISDLVALRPKASARLGSQISRD